MKIQIRSSIAAAVLLITALAVYRLGLQGGFLFDDIPNLLRAQAWKAGSLAPAELVRALHSDISGDIGRPLALLSFAINHAFTGTDPFWLKLINLAMHAFNGLLVWLLCRLVFTLLPPSSRPNAWATWLVAAAWLLHPLQASTVLYVVQRMEIGAATGILLSLLAYSRARLSQLEGRPAWHWLLMSVMAMLFGLGFKETALLAPGFALLLEACVFRFHGHGGRPSKPWQLFWGIATLLAITIWAWLGWQLIHSPWRWAARDFGPGERMLTQLPVLAMYVKQILLPLPESMTFYYDNFPVSRTIDLRTLTGVGVLSALAAIALASWKRWPLTALGIGWFFVGHALTSNLWPLELAFEHRNYLPLFGLLLALVQPLQWTGRKLHGDARSVLACLPVLALAVLCLMQARTWGDPTLLAWTLENRNPDSPRASYALGARLLESAENDPSNISWAMAKGQFEHAADFPGRAVLPLQALLVMQGQAGHAIASETWARFRDVLTGEPLHAEAVGALYAVSQCSQQQRCRFDQNELLETWLAVLEHSPDNPRLHTMYANYAWNALGDRALAIRVQRDAVHISPTSPAYQVALAKFLLTSQEEALVMEGRELTAALHRQNRDGLLDADLRELERLAALAATGSPDQTSDPTRP